MFVNVTYAWLTYETNSRRIRYYVVTFCVNNICCREINTQSCASGSTPPTTKTCISVLAFVYLQTLAGTIVEVIIEAVAAGTLPSPTPQPNQTNKRLFIVFVHSTVKCRLSGSGTHFILIFFAVINLKEYSIKDRKYSNTVYRFDLTRNMFSNA